MQNRIHHISRRGFTMLELLVVVFIISVLTATAIPMVNKYLKKSKSSEASLNLRKIYDGEVSYYQEEHTLQSGEVTTKEFITTAAEPSVPSDQKQLGNWEATEWQLIKFAADGPVQYSYQAVASGAGLDAEFTARAHGDLDGDGTTSLFERVGSVDSASGEVEGGAAVYSLDELE